MSMRSLVQRTWLLALLALSAAAPNAQAGPGAHGPNGEHLDAPAASNASGATGLARLPDGSVSMPKQAQRRMEIRTVVGHEAAHAQTVELNARVTIDPNAGGQVQAPFAGRIEPSDKGLPVAGQAVKKGQALLRLSPIANAVERGNQEAQLAEIRASRTLAKQRVARLEALQGTVPQKDIEAARAELASLQGREKAIANSVGGVEIIRAPATGLIASSTVLAGKIVDAREVLFEIIDPERMLVEAVTTDATLASRIEGAALANFPGVELVLIGGARSLRDGGLPLYFRARAKDAALAIGQPVTVVAKLKESVKGIALPAAAVVRNPSNQPIVWVKNGAERFVAHAVAVRPLDAGTVVVTGIDAGSRVVVSGAALINQIR